MISLKHNFLFVHIPKTAGNSIQSILKDYSEDEIVCFAAHQDGIERFDIRNPIFNIRKHSTLYEYQREIEETVFNKLFKFTCVRNPWDRLMSFYFAPFRGKNIQWDRNVFLRVIQECASAPAYVRLRNSDSEKRPFGNMNFIMRFENLNEDF